LTAIVLLKKGEELLARAFQQEYDHLEGTNDQGSNEPAVPRFEPRRRLKELLDENNETEPLPEDG
jgi:hypothetical protein